MTAEKQKVALITGANSGVGLELTKKMLSEGWQVAALIRSDFARDEAIIAQAIASKQLRTYTADLSDFTELRNALDEIKQRETHIDVLFNNAGISLGQMRDSRQGREIHFEVNTVAPYIILMELKALILQGSLKLVVNTSSNALLFLKQFDVNSLEKPVTFKKLFGPYATSKLALSLWTQEIAASLLEEGIQIRSVCPGANKTAMTKSGGMPLFLIPIRNLFFSHPSHGASRLYDAAFGKSADLNGVFLNKGKITPLRCKR